MQLDVGLLTLLLGTGLPLVTGLVTKYFASSRVKALTLFGLSILATSIQGALDTGGVVDLKTWVGTSFVTFFIGVGAYFGFWKPTEVAEKVNAATYDFGIGEEVFPVIEGDGPDVGYDDEADVIDPATGEPREG
jgi:hypothetical protein